MFLPLLGIIADLFASEIKRVRIMGSFVAHHRQMCWNGSLVVVLGDSASRLVVLSISLLGLSAHQSMFLWMNC